MIYRDALGRPSAGGSISLFGGNYGNPGQGYLALSSVSDAPEKRWAYVSLDVSEIVAEMDADGWDCVVTKDGYNAPLIRCTHRETAAEELKIQKQTDEIFANAKEGFIRFGRAPKSGKSRNHRDNYDEKGVSCFRALFTGKKYRLNVNHVEEATYYGVMHRPAYRIYGTVIGVGADGEPLLKVTKQIAL